MNLSKLYTNIASDLKQTWPLFLNKHCPFTTENNVFLSVQHFVRLND